VPLGGLGPRCTPRSAAHGLFAVVTLVLVLLTALGVGG